jgi:hypothetical protein
MLASSAGNQCAMDRQQLQSDLNRIAALGHDDAGTYRVLVRTSSALLALAEAEKRELTAWEKIHLYDALISLLLGQNWLAWAGLDMALSTPDDIARCDLYTENREAFDEFGIADFRRVLGHLATPVRLH